jgi:dTDP-4-amino-4,6-dideoxygalactose transaminase
LSRRTLMLKLNKKNISTQVHYIPVYRQPFYKNKFNLNKKYFPQAECYYQKALSIPIFPELTNNDLDYIVHSVKTLLN